MLVLYLLTVCASALAYARHSPTLYDVEDAENIFEEFIKKHNKVYSNEQEKQERFNIFKDKLEIVNKLRSSESGQQASFDINDFSDLTQDEIESRYMGLKLGPMTVEYEPVTVRKDLPDKYDWRNHNAVTPIKSQGRCGSCWAFSTIGTVEGAYAVKHKKLLSFSEQQLVSCDKIDGGCDGGNMIDALNYLQSAGGIETDSDYPYEGTDEPNNCKFNLTKAKAKITGQKAIKFGDDEATKQALIDNGPMSIAIWASHDFETYKHGILKCPTGVETNLNHGVVLTGYGTENGVPYWIIKNSWGVKHGDKGYWRVQRGNNPCGMDYYGGILAQVA